MGNRSDAIRLLFATLTIMEGGRVEDITPTLYAKVTLLRSEDASGGSFIDGLEREMASVAAVLLSYAVL